MSIDSLVQDWLEGQDEGAAVLVLQDGQVVHSQGYGQANTESGRKPDASTIFDLASCSKHFTATAIMMLAEKGKLSYDDPLTKFFPFPDYADEITVRHLLHHTAGLKDYFELYEADDEDAERWGELSSAVSADIVSALSQEPEPAFAAGEQFDYSNSGYVVLAEIVSKASGKPFPRFMQDEVFGPLGMKRSYVNDGSRATDPNQAQGYEEGEPFEATPLDNAYGDGAVRSTLDDLVKWDAAMDAHRLVSKKTREEAWTTGTLNDESETGYGFGWFVGEDGVNHEGSYGGFRTYYSKELEAKRSVIILSNFAEADFDKLSEAISAHYAGEEDEEDESEEADEDE